jgi:hypothetical protein
MTTKAELLKQYLTPLDASENSEYITKKQKKKKKKTSAAATGGGMKIVDVDALSTVASASSDNHNEFEEQGYIHVISVAFFRANTSAKNFLRLLAHTAFYFGLLQMTNQLL